METIQTILILTVMALTGLVGISLGGLFMAAVQRRRETS
jgi:hypothetical protein